MESRRPSARRLASSALVGAVALESILLFSSGSREIFTVRQLPSHILAVVVGTLGGWIFEVFKDLLAATGESLTQLGNLRTSVAALSERINYQDSALAMLTACPRHNQALTALIKASMSDNFRNIPFVTPAEYLRLLETSIEHSDGYEGVQRRSLRWYRERDAGGYLEALKYKRMSYKVRLFVLDETAQREMLEDLADPELVAYYWEHTGRVDSYWVSEADFQKNFPQLPTPQDFAMYDRQLLIRYDEDRQILGFDVLAEDSDQSRIFRDLRQLLESHSAAAFTRIPIDAARPAPADSPLPIS